MIKICKNQQELNDFQYAGHQYAGIKGGLYPTKYPVLATRTLDHIQVSPHGNYQSGLIIDTLPTYVVSFIEAEELFNFIEEGRAQKFKKEFKDVVEGD